MSKTEFNLPIFPGFYNTIFEFDSEYVQESINQDIEDGITKTDISVVDDLDIDYRGYCNDIAIACVDVVSTKLLELELISSPIEFIGVSSPKYYNYRNDQIVVCADVHTANIAKYLIEHKEAFHKYLEDEHTSRDGYISFIDNSVEQWLIPNIDWNSDGVNVEVALEFILRNEIEDPIMWLYYGLDVGFSDGVTALSYEYVMQALFERSI